jgi:hypothetical protein
MKVIFYVGGKTTCCQSWISLDFPGHPQEGDLFDRPSVEEGTRTWFRVWKVRWSEVPGGWCQRVFLTEIEPPPLMKGTCAKCGRLLCHHGRHNWCPWCDLGRLRATRAGSIRVLCNGTIALIILVGSLVLNRLWNWPSAVALIVLGALVWTLL